MYISMSIYICIYVCIILLTRFARCCSSSGSALAVCVCVCGAYATYAKFKIRKRIANC